MRKLIANAFLYLDGVMQAPGGPGEDPSGGFELEGWSVNYWNAYRAALRRRSRSTRHAQPHVCSRAWLARLGGQLDRRAADRAGVISSPAPGTCWT
jgi:hypothetical protein